MTHYDSPLFQPIKIGNLTLKNRVACGPYASCLNELDGTPGLRQYKHVENIAKGGACSMTMGSTNINKTPLPAPVTDMNNPFSTGRFVNIIEVCHQYGCAASVELVGGKEMFMPPEVFVNQPVEGLKQFVNDYADAAEEAMKRGFDMIMIHGGHGMPIAAMMRESINHRTDEYGGSFENRARLGREILEAIRARVGDKIAIEYRISDESDWPGGVPLEEMIRYAAYVEDLVDLFLVSRGVLEGVDLIAQVFPPAYYEHGPNIEVAAQFKAALTKPVSVIGAVEFEQAEAAILAGKVDMVTMVRRLLADPSAVNKYMRGQEDEIRPCVRCNTCINQSHGRLWDVRCAVNPLIGRETYFPPVERKLDTKKVVLVGGGPANLEAARTAAKRGHEVVLFEKADKLGGKLLLATADDLKTDMQRYLEWSIRDVKKYPNVDIRLNTEATEELILAEQPDAMIIAIGAEPILPKFSASGTDKIVWVGDYELNHSLVGDTAVVCGGGFTGLEAALELAREGKKVTIVDMLPMEALGAGGTLMNTVALMQMLMAAGVSFACKSKILDITETGVSIVDEEGCEKVLPCDTAVLSFGFKRDAEAVQKLSRLVPESYVIGDCSTNGGTVWAAVRAGFDMAMNL